MNNTRKIKYIPSIDTRSKDFNDFILQNYAHFLTEPNPDLILVTGGDGAMIHAIQENYSLGVPFVGRAAGSLNYLMNTVNDNNLLIEKLLDSSVPLHLNETTSIKVDLLNFDKSLFNLGYAVNEVVLGQNIMGYHSYVISSEDGSFDNFEIRGSGLSISTDLGSTAYNFNLGGSVLPLGSNLWSVVGVVCNRYLNDILHIQKITIMNSSKIEAGKFSVFVDGIKKQVILGSGQTVVLNKGLPIQIAFLNKTDFIRKRVDIASRYRKS